MDMPVMAALGQAASCASIQPRYIRLVALPTWLRGIGFAIVTAAVSLTIVGSLLLWSSRDA